MEQICFPANEACTPQMMIDRVLRAPEMFVVAEDTDTGRLAGMVTGLATDEEKFRDEFFSDVTLFNPAGKNVMILGVEVLPEYRGRGLARAMLDRFAADARAQGRECLYLTCLEEKVVMYRKLGFKDLGLSASSWGGESWHEMSRRLDSQ